MARISNLDPGKAGFVQGIFARIAFWMSRRITGKVVTPVKVMAHHPRILWGFGQMDEAVKKGGRVEEDLLSLVQLRAATLVGCPF